MNRLLLGSLCLLFAAGASLAQDDRPEAGLPSEPPVVAEPEPTEGRASFATRPADLPPRSFSEAELAAIYGDEYGEGRKALQTVKGLSAERARRMFDSLTRGGAQGEVFHTVEESFQSTSHIYLAVLWDPHTAVHQGLTDNGRPKRARDLVGVPNPNDWYITADLGFCMIKNPDEVGGKKDQDVRREGLLKRLASKLRGNRTESVRYLNERYTKTRANRTDITTAGVLDFLHHTTVRLRYTEADGQLVIVLEDPHDADTHSFQTRSISKANSSRAFGVHADFNVGLSSGRQAGGGIKSERQDGRVAHIVTITDIPYVLRPTLSVHNPVDGQNDVVVRMGIRWQMLAKCSGHKFTPLRSNLQSSSNTTVGINGAVNGEDSNGTVNVDSNSSSQFSVEQLPESELRLHTQGEVAVAVEYREEDHDTAFHLRRPDQEGLGAPGLEPPDPARRTDLAHGRRPPDSDQARPRRSAP